ncbi:MAG: UvrD-helicase domain-containing protein [Alphaproteobacteria bacterium]|nr:UvrD-helicase domain-containing protein [Reyranella sp.]MBL6853364.1 UvrD-helicase domain-containing protein [Alphaproteobacteria bacterium]MBL6940104.1 UvrD-helicase domain-containing protein [Alphaproteobacteria bacterium]MBL7100191.1 UvrD-helicase domain-containing protein [Alphaproteobacteria bacterium]
MPLDDLRDAPARIRALTDHTSTLLVEAGAGTGKTALMAGRIVMLLAAGADPREIAAITFTELAASALDARVHRYITWLRAGRIPETLRLALPDGALSDPQKSALAKVAPHLDQLTIATIHSFCQTLISSYAVEASIDPGARMLDADQAGTFFDNVFDTWIKGRFSRTPQPDDPIAALSRDDPRRVVDRLRQFAEFRRRHREARTFDDDLEGRPDIELNEAIAAFRRWANSLPRAPQKTTRLLTDLEKLAPFFKDSFATKPDFARLWHLAHEVPVIECMGYQGAWKQAELEWPPQEAEWSMASRTDGARLHAEAKALFDAVDQCYRSIMGRIATATMARLARDLDEIIAAYDHAKRAAAVLDFDDLLIKARALVRGHEAVRQALARRYRYLFVDEFQDTDQIQAEVIFAIGAESLGAGWHQNRLREGALFLVGDPKQSIYRFRGADLGCYCKARDAINGAHPGNVLKISENFRSREDILTFVNDRFGPLFRGTGLDYEDLTSTRVPPVHNLPVVSRLPINADGRKKESLRRAEAEAVADLCARLIGNIEVREGEGTRPLKPGDIALLSPGWTDLWRYEHALESRGLPIATQAGKGFFGRQEVQDLLSLARTLADPRDYLAFGALMRGPLIGLKDEELLDIVERLPPSLDEPGAIPRFSLMTPTEEVADHALAQATLEILKSLQRKAMSTTPGLLLTEAIERLNIRAIVTARDTRDSGRAVANLELFLERARGYRVRGLGQFVQDVTREWSERNNAQVEGQIDADGSAINLITIHSAKGLEWPVVIPVNMCSGFGQRPRLLHRPADDTLHWVIDDVAPPSVFDARRSIEAENECERQRMWYVTCTRAEELLIVPDIPRLRYQSWSGLVELNVGALPSFPLESLPTQPRLAIDEPTNHQTKETFDREFAAIAAKSVETNWVQPSSHDEDRAELVEALLMAPEEAVDALEPVGGGKIRGLALHKMMEEILTGEVQDEETALATRARVLLGELGSEAEEGAELPEPAELAATVRRTLLLPEIKRLRPRLIPEYPVYGAPDKWTAVSGRIDAIAPEDEGAVVVDWKSDIAPSEGDIQEHLRQTKDYCEMVGARTGLVVYMSTGKIFRFDTGEAP